MAVTLLEGTKKENYVFIYDPGMLEVIQREEEVQRDEAKDHHDIILAVMFPYEVPDGMELLGVSRSCHPDNDYDPANATHGLLTAVPKVPEGQKPTQEGFYYDPEKGTVTLYAKDFCLFGFHLKKKTTPSPCPCVTPPCSESSNPCTVECPYGYQIKVALSD